MFCPQSEVSTLRATHIPMFTLTVPAAFANQYVQLCVQSLVSTRKSLCHVIRIDDGATISIPVTSDVEAKVLSGARPKSKAQIQKAISALHNSLAGLVEGTTTTHTPRKTTNGSRP